jgi:hypothetical protein
MNSRFMALHFRAVSRFCGMARKCNTVYDWLRQLAQKCNIVIVALSALAVVAVG